MSTHRKIEYAIFFLGLGGLLFSGYMSAVKFFTETCAFNESCPYFLGYPSCYYGFAMFVVITLFSGLHVMHWFGGKDANRIVLLTSCLGVLFSGYFTVLELPSLFTEGIAAYFFGLPTCALGSLFLQQLLFFHIV